MSIKKITSFLLCAVTAAGLMLSGCGSVNPDAVMLNVNKGEKTVSAGFVNFVCRLNQAHYDRTYLMYFGDNMWVEDNNALTDEVKNNILLNIKQYIACEKHASEMGISISSEDEAKIAAAVDEFMNSNSADSLQKMGATKEYVTEYLRYVTLYNRIADSIAEAAQPTTTEDDVWQRTVDYVYFDTVYEVDAEGNQKPASEEYINAAKEDAKKVAADFDGQKDQVGGNVGSINYTKGDTTGAVFEADMVSKIDALAEGKVSDPIETDEGIFVVKVTADKNEEATATKLAAANDEEKTQAAEDAINEWVEGITFDLNDAEWNKIQFTELFVEPVTTAQ